ncbi:MAG: hypothetical protein AAF690_02655 [Acidobacteriota bacterium]
MNSLDLKESSERPSPLWMVTREPALNYLVSYLTEKRSAILSEPQAEHLLRFRAAELEEARSAFARMILSGEEHLHRLAELLSQLFYGVREYGIRSVVVGQLPGEVERFTLVQGLSRSDLYAQTDLDLGTRLLERFRMRREESWERASLVANFVEYEPLQASRYGVHKVISRIKAEEEIWNKVVDEIFQIDDILERDKQLRHLSRFVKDIFGVKVVVASSEKARELQLLLESQDWSSELLAALEVEASKSSRELSFLEVKDYLGEGEEAGTKSSGWRAVKSVVRWSDQLFEIQIQPLRNYHQELERFTQESHEEFKAQREAVRNTLARQVPLFGYYRDLLRWLFEDPTAAPPRFQGVTVELID